MFGRYGTDAMNRFLSIAALALLGVSMLLRFLRVPAAEAALYWGALALLVWSLFRTFSRNAWKRGQENQAFLRVSRKVTGRFSGWRVRWKQRKTHRFYTCPQCKTSLRVPRGRGKLVITCPKCKSKLERRT
jgi:DNA-directed RNA polymerase subunit RPC12/RpoP